MRTIRAAGYLQAAFSIVSVIAGLIALVWIFLQHRLVMQFLLNSDAFYLPALYIDLFRNGGTLKDWFLTPAPYFVPDWPIYFLSMRLFGQPYLAIAGFFVVQILLSFVLAVAINKRFSTMPNAVAGAAFSILFCCLLSARMVEPFSFMLLSAYHYGAFLMLLSAVWLMAGGMQKQSGSGGYALGVFAVTTMATLSDKLFLVQFSLPAFATLLYMCARSKSVRNAGMTFMVSIAAGSVLGPLLYKHMVVNVIDPSAGFSLENVSKNFHELFAITRNLMDGNAYALAMVMLFYLCAAVSTSLFRKSSKAELESSNALLLVTVFSLCSAAALVIVELLNKMPLNGRYLISLFFIPIFFGPALILGRLTETKANIAGTLLLIASAICIHTLGRVAAENDLEIKTDFYPEDVACIDAATVKYGLKNGIAEYWDAKRVSILSKSAVNLAQVFPDLSEQKWITTTTAFRETYDFALINDDVRAPVQPNEARIVEINGPPVANVKCGSIRVMVYPQDELATKKHNR